MTLAMTLAMALAMALASKSRAIAARDPVNQYFLAAIM